MEIVEHNVNIKYFLNIINVINCILLYLFDFKDFLIQIFSLKLFMQLEQQVLGRVFVTVTRIDLSERNSLKDLARPRRKGFLPPFGISTIQGSSENSDKIDLMRFM